jgi:pimeloyl-ACP methyl ester carboxylesterase
MSTFSSTFVVLGLSTHPVSFIGYDLGGAVATGFCAKYPDLCQSLTLIAAMGCKYRVLEKEALIKKKYFGEYIVFKRRGTFGPAQEDDFHDTHIEAPHRAMIDKQIAMINWQILNTPGYLGAILSTIRLFPMRGMEELFTAIGRFKRPVLVLWGDNDEITPYKKCIKVSMNHSLSNNKKVWEKECRGRRNSNMSVPVYFLFTSR